MRSSRPCEAHCPIMPRVLMEEQHSPQCEADCHSPGVAYAWGGPETSHRRSSLQGLPATNLRYMDSTGQSERASKAPPKYQVSQTALVCDLVDHIATRLTKWLREPPPKVHCLRESWPNASQASLCNYKSTVRQLREARLPDIGECVAQRAPPFLQRPRRSEAVTDLSQDAGLQRQARP